MKPPNARGGALLSWRLWTLLGLLLLAAVPWYWPAGDQSRLGGVPAWAAVAVMASAAASVVVALAIWFGWPDEDEDERREDRETENKHGGEP
jgi:type VI protein secretion system component VasK